MKIKIKGKTYNIEISEPQNNAVVIKVDGEEFVFSPENLRNDCPKKEKESKKKLKKEIRAPIAGNISKIFVKEGEEISLGRKILSLSAMKMENEIISEGKGKIKKILAKEGQAVKANELLAELE